MRYDDCHAKRLLNKQYEEKYDDEKKEEQQESKRAVESLSKELNNIEAISEFTECSSDDL